MMYVSSRHGKAWNEKQRANGRSLLLLRSYGCSLGGALRWLGAMSQAGLRLPGCSAKLLLHKALFLAKAIPGRLWLLQSRMQAEDSPESKQSPKHNPRSALGADTTAYDILVLLPLLLKGYCSGAVSLMR
jgi:hypothetical protein